MKIHKGLERIEMEVYIEEDRGPSEKYPNYGESFRLKGSDGVNYEWNTTALVDQNIIKGQTWLVRMTIEREMKCCSYKYTRVKNVRFIKQIR